MRVGNRHDAAVKIALSSHQGAIREALGRGVSFSAIADCLGVSPQGVQSYCAKHDLGKPSEARRRTHRSVIEFDCHFCGKPATRAFHSGDLFRYCSRKCRSAETRNPNLNNVVEAITLRLNGIKWISVAKRYGCAPQTLQKSIYQFLVANDLFSPQSMSAVWRLDEGSWSLSPARYRWITNQGDRLLSEASMRRYRDASYGDLVAGLLGLRRIKCAQIERDELESNKNKGQAE